MIAYFCKCLLVRHRVASGSRGCTRTFHGGRNNQPFHFRGSSCSLLFYIHRNNPRVDLLKKGGLIGRAKEWEEQNGIVLVVGCKQYLQHRGGTPWLDHDMYVLCAATFVVTCTARTQQLKRDTRHHRVIFSMCAILSFLSCFNH